MTTASESRDNLHCRATYCHNALTELTLLSVALFLLTIMPSWAKADVALTQSDAGTSIVLKQGEILTISLVQYSDGGYLWEILPGYGAYLALFNEETIWYCGGGSSRNQIPGCTGGYSIVNYNFRAVTPGQVLLSLIMRRPWETDVPPIQTFEVEVQLLSTPYGNHAPTISGTPSPHTTVGDPYTFTPTAVDLDSDTLTFSIANKPGWATFSDSNGTLSGTPGTGDSGYYGDIQISVSDGKGGSASLPAFTIAVGLVHVGYNPEWLITTIAVLMLAGGYLLRRRQKMDISRR